MTPRTTAHQASLSITNSRSPPMMSSSVVLFSSCLQSSSIRVFSNESALCIRQPKYWSFSFNISPSNEYSGLISFRMDWSLRSKGRSRVFSNTTVQMHQFFSAQLSFFFFPFFLFYFIFKLYNIVLVLPNIEMNPPQVYLCSPS